MKRALAIAIGVALAGPALAARNASGTYTLSPAAPFLTNTPISSSTMNTRFSDLASELTDSLSRSGKGGMLSPLKLYSGGSAAAPELTWLDDVNSGFYLIGADNVGLSIGGSKRWDFTATTSTTAGDLAVSGAIYGNSISSNGADSFVTAIGNPTDDADAVAFVVNTGAGLANATAKLVSIKNFGTEKAYFDKDGNLFMGGEQAATQAYVNRDGGWVNREKLEAVGEQATPTSGTFSTASAVYVDVTNLSVTITTTGRPVVLSLGGSGLGSSYLSITRTAGSGNAYLYLRIDRGGSLVAEHVAGLQATASGIEYNYPLSVVHVDTPVAGTYTYKIQVRCVGADMAAKVYEARLIAYEL